MKRSKYILLFIPFFFACSPEAKLTRLLKKHPELKKDSIKVYTRHDTIIVKGIRKDSVINNIFTKDTVIIRDKELTVKYVYEGNNKAYLQGAVKADTIIRNDTIRIVKTMSVKVEQKTFWQKLKAYILTFIIAFVLGIIFIIVFIETKPRL